ncbi:VOC family protein [Flavobacterium sp. DG1-102-2]|uniref:VOC family protein n=1 Tax=Flavobacterium sp. DG1-102-2 TaxID=3081663 RepID=UPI002949146E|nr:VOC family protein [Flavobacterium sp. DG1-102-2]MDV6169701.1 VOC family protein [Flavobacterium sp. DG1-102-2]
MTAIKQIFVNLPVKNLDTTVKFFTKLGFTFNPDFTDENATCMIIGENIFAMLLKENFFSTFTKKPLADAKTTTEVINAFSLGSRQEVDDMIEKAIAAGAKQYKETEDHGWMYGRNFEDPDGHQWEFFFMDMNAIPKE